MFNFVNLATADDGWSENGERFPGERNALIAFGEEFAFHYCPPGTFLMGSPEDEEGRRDWETQHEVTLTRGFWLMETPVTQEQWRAVTGKSPSRFSGEANLPVERVSWKVFQKFIKKLNNGGYAPDGWKFSLPTEAQWEYACRAGTTTPFSWGSTLNGDKANCWGSYPYGTKTKGPWLMWSSPVKSYSPNAWGFYDMHGNVSEWRQDVLGKYPSTAVTDPVGSKEGEGYKWNVYLCMYDDETGGSYRVSRGGSWQSFASSCRAANRYGFDADLRSEYAGGRLALVPAR